MKGNAIQPHLTTLANFGHVFLAALAPSSPCLTNTAILTVLDSSLAAFQTKPKPCKTDGGHEKTWPDQQKDNDKDNDNYNDKHGRDMTWPTKVQ